mgnify:CR=1 FL=1
MVRKFLHIGCGLNKKDSTTDVFNSPDWHEVRLDINPSVNPDIVSSIQDMSAIDDDSFDAVYSSHNVEHIYSFDVLKTFNEIHRVLKNDGFLILTCPDLKAICSLIADGKILDKLYDSPSGPIYPLDVIYGYQKSIFNGNEFMAHKNGFTVETIVSFMETSNFRSYVAAEAVGLSGDGDIEGAENILDIALKFPYGVDGKLNLTAHPDYQGKVNTLKKQINDFAFTQEKRRQIQKERDKNDDIINTLKRFAETGDAGLIADLQKRQPLEASKIGTAAVALDGNTRDRSAQIESRIIEGGYASKKDAAIAAYNWYNDDKTPKTQANRTRLSQLLGVANSSENGDYTEINKGLAELNSQLKGEFSGALFIVGTTGQLNDKGSSAVNDLFNAAKLELYTYILGPEGREADTLTVIKKIEEIKGTYLKKAREQVNLLTPKSGVTEGGKVNKQNIDDIQGDAGFISEVTDEEAKQIIEKEDAEESNNIFTVKRGDTLTSIATQTGVSIPNLIKLNNIKDPNNIQVGDNLILKETETKTTEATTETTTTPTITQSSKQQAIVTAANELGVKPEDLASVISQETMGTFNHQITGGEGGNYKGLIQFGIPERKKYGYRDDMTFEEQIIGPVVRYLKDRGVKPGHGVKEIYAAILTGNVSTLQSDGLTRTDSFGTSVESALPELSQGGSHYKNALDFLAEQGKFQQKS